MARTSSSSEPPPLVCPSCATPHPLTERFCPQCGMPLTYAGTAAEEPVSARQERARKIKPQLAEGQLVKVAGARNQAEAEFLQGLLLEEGVPSVLRRARGFDVPDFLAAGPRDVLVPASGYQIARDVLLQADLEPLLPSSSGVDAPWRVLAGVLIAVALVAIIAWLGTELFV
jgi:zinc-ribbon domain